MCLALKVCWDCQQGQRTKQIGSNTYNSYTTNNYPSTISRPIVKDIIWSNPQPAGQQFSPNKGKKWIVQGGTILHTLNAISALEIINSALTLELFIYQIPAATASQRMNIDFSTICQPLIIYDSDVVLFSSTINTDYAALRVVEIDY